MPNSVLDLCACWCPSGRTRSAVVWKIVLICIFWTIWRERNNMCFEHLKSSMEEILTSLLYSLYSWTVTYLSPLSLCYVEFFFYAFFFPPLVRCFFCIYLMYFWGLTLFNKILLTYMKKKFTKFHLNLIYLLINSFRRYNRVAEPPPTSMATPFFQHFFKIKF